MSAIPEIKDRSATPGSWKPGQCGNPKGRPKMTEEDREVKAILKAACPKVALKLVELLDCANPKVVLSTCEVILNRVYGKPRESVDMTVTQEDDTQLKVRSVILEELKRKRDDNERECRRDDYYDGGERDSTFAIDFE